MYNVSSFSNAIGYASNYSNLFRIDVIDAETGIGEVKGVYDLQGRRVENLSKGIYIIDGRKVFVK